MANVFRAKRTRTLTEGDSVVVVGLGRFGKALAVELAQSGVEVMGVDTDEEIVQELNGILTQVVRADATKEDVLHQLGIGEFTHAVVAIGSDIEASILASSWLLRFEVPAIWAKAISEPHGQILRQLGVHHVVYPEADMGRRVAHLLRGSLADYQEIGAGFAMVTAAPPPSMVGKSLDELGFRKKHNLNVVAVRRPDGEWQHATGETVLSWDDQIIVMGPKEIAEHFIDMA